ncbi:MAG: zinc ribbon domain-containing protein [Chitinispirillaceae bacterium]|nr:zinc ribbon domain-containing protein [Chitinispirillaceae bacterium]
MPMYEFYCSSCNTIFTFFSRAINTEKIPPCPKNDSHALKRMVSRFAVTGTSKAKREGDGDDTMPDLPIDESRLEKAMESLSAEAENINEDDPRQAANLMRKLTDMTGLRLGDKMEDALSRMEAGEDPDAIERELGDIDESDLFSLSHGGKSGVKSRSPVRDDTLYEM